MRVAQPRTYTQHIIILITLHLLRVPVKGSVLGGKCRIALTKEEKKTTTEKTKKHMLDVCFCRIAGYLPIEMYIYL